MIAAVHGIVKDKNNSKVIINTASGVWYEVFASANTLDQLELEQEKTLFTTLIVREQEMYLVGFLNLAEKHLFEILITAKGIGAKQGIKILGELSGDELRIAIISGDISGLSKIKGISSKKAEQLILDLQEKLKKTVNEFDTDSSIPTSSKIKTEILLTMRALGYSDNEVKKPLDTFFENTEYTSKNTEMLVSEFLMYLKSN